MALDRKVDALLTLKPDVAIVCECAEPERLRSKASWMQGEPVWIGRYVETRHDWLANNANALLRKTVYRMESFAGLITSDNWALAPPFFLAGSLFEFLQ